MKDLEIKSIQNENVLRDEIDLLKDNQNLGTKSTIENLEHRRAPRRILTASCDRNSAKSTAPGCDSNDKIHQKLHKNSLPINVINNDIHKFKLHRQAISGNAFTNMSSGTRTGTTRLAMLQVELPSGGAIACMHRRCMMHRRLQNDGGI